MAKDKISPESIYLDFVNNYLTVKVMAEHYNMTEGKLRKMINKGKIVNLNK